MSQILLVRHFPPMGFGVIGRLVVIVLFGLGLSACGTPKRDLAAICALVTEVQSQKRLTQKKKTIRIMKKIRSVVSTSEVQKLIKTVSNKPKRKRYKAFVRGAKKLGMENYRCTPAKKWLEST